MGSQQEVLQSPEPLFQPQLQFSIPCSQRAPKGLPKGSQWAPRGLPGGSQRAPRGPVVLQVLLPSFPQRPFPRSLVQVPWPHWHRSIRGKPTQHSCTPTSPHPGFAWVAPAGTCKCLHHVCLGTHHLDVHLDTWFPAQVEVLWTPSISEAAQECSQSSGLPGQGSFGIRPLAGRAGTCPWW